MSRARTPQAPPAPELGPERVLLEEARIAFSDLRQLCDAAGEPLPPHRLPEDAARAVAAMEVVESVNKSGERTVRQPGPRRVASRATSASRPVAWSRKTAAGRGGDSQGSTDPAGAKGRPKSFARAKPVAKRSGRGTCTCTGSRPTRRQPIFRYPGKLFRLGVLKTKATPAARAASKPAWVRRVKIPRCRQAGWVTVSTALNTARVWLPPSSAGISPQAACARCPSPAPLPWD